MLRESSVCQPILEVSRFSWGMGSSVEAVSHPLVSREPKVSIMLDISAGDERVRLGNYSERSQF
jgi:hypothetical protein